MKPTESQVSKNEIIGEILNFLQDVKEQVKAPFDGVISLTCASPEVGQGNWILQMFEVRPNVILLYSISTLFTFFRARSLEKLLCSVATNKVTRCDFHPRGTLYLTDLLTVIASRVESASGWRID